MLQEPGGPIGYLAQHTLFNQVSKPEQYLVLGYVAILINRCAYSSLHILCY